MDTICSVRGMGDSRLFLRQVDVQPTYPAWRTAVLKSALLVYFVLLKHRFLLAGLLHGLNLISD